MVSRPILPATHGLTGLGVDLIDVDAVAASIARHGDAYTGRVFTPDEVRDCRAAPTPSAVARRFAARFAAKEAVFKALRWDDRGASWHAVELVRTLGGEYDVMLQDPLRAAARAAGVTRLAVSMSHDAGLATAVVTATRHRASQSE